MGTAMLSGIRTQSRLLQEFELSPTLAPVEPRVHRFYNSTLLML